MPYWQAIKSVPVVLPLWHELIEQTRETGVVLRLEQVDNLVGDDVLEALFRLLC